MIESLPRVQRLPERTAMYATILFHALSANLLQWCGIGSALAPIFTSMGMAVGCLLDNGKGRVDPFVSHSFLSSLTFLDLIAF